MLNLHPLFIHFPIALLTVGFLFDLIGVLLKKESLNNAGWWCQLAGIFGGAVAVGTGLWAESTVPHGGASHELMENHKILAIISFSILFVAFIWRAVNKSKLPESKQILVG